MKTRFARRLWVGLWIAFAAPALLRAGTNVWTGSRLAAQPGLSQTTLVASFAGDPDVVYSAQGSELFRSADGGRTWARVAVFTQIFALYVDPVSGAVSVGGWRDASGASVFKSADGGATWTPTLDFGFQTTANVLAGTRRNPSLLYASNGYALYRSDDAGDTWKAVSRPVAGSLNSQVIAALIIDPADGTTADVGGYDYNYPYYEPLTPFFRESTDAGGTWSDLSSGLGSDASVSAIAIDPAGPDTIYLGMSRTSAASLFRSIDGGVSWAPADSGLPERTEVTSLLLDPADSQTLYAGTSDGVFWSRDAAASWQSLAQCMSGLPAGSLTLDPVAPGARGRILRAGNSAGAFALEIGAGALDVAAGSGRSHVLSWDADSLTVRTLEDAGGESSTSPEGPSLRWLASAIADGPDGRSRVLWLAGDGRAALEVVGSAGREAAFLFPALSHWAAADLSVGADGTAHLLWTSVSGGMYLTRVDGAGNVTLGPSYGPYPNWTALAIADAPDGSTRVLWRANDGRFSISVHHGLAMGEVVRFASIPGRAAADITVASDGNARVLLVGTDGTAEVATVDALGSLANARTQSQVGFRPQRLAAGPDGLTRLLWSDAAGSARVSLLDTANSTQSQPGSSRSAQ